MNIVQFSNFANEWPHQPQPHAKVRTICVKIGAYPPAELCPNAPVGPAAVAASGPIW